MLSPEPILDVVRGLSTVASFMVVVNQAKVLYEEIFTSECARCRGTGRVLCLACRGTKTLRSYPGELRPQKSQVADRSADDLYPCMFCGDGTMYDEEPQEDDEGDAYDIMDNLKAAVAGKQLPVKLPLTAGLIPCPECFDDPIIWRHTPNWERITGIEEPFHFQVSQRVGSYQRDPQRRLYMEYPSRPPNDEDIDIPLIAREMIAETIEAEELARAGDPDADTKEEIDEERSKDDYIYPYVDDPDTEESDDDEQ